MDIDSISLSRPREPLIFATDKSTYLYLKTMNLLFVCSENQLRSPTAEAIFNTYEGISAIGAGTNKDAETTVSGDLIEWADIIFVMEKSHKNKITKKFKELIRNKRLICLDIPDDYDRMDSILIRLLIVKVSRYILLKKNI